MTIHQELDIKISHVPKQRKVPTHLCLPFEAGQLTQLNQLRLFTGDNEVLFSAEALTTWPDQSFKWVRLGFIIPTEATNLVLKIASVLSPAPTIPSGKGIVAQFDAESHSIKICYNNITKQTYNISTQSPNLTSLFNKETLDISAFESIRIVNSTKLVYHFKGNGHYIEHFYCPHTGACLESKILISGQFISEQQQRGPLGKIGITFFENSPYVKTDIELHNPLAAQHLAGQWDLGDPNSFKIDSFSLQISTEHQEEIKLYPEAGDKHLNATLSNLSIQQSSSGGENWQSPVHVDANNRVNIIHHGYRLTQSGKTIGQGLRATPVLVLEKLNKNKNQIILEQFWQRFPKKISIVDQCINIDLLPNLNSESAELQGGEKLCNTLWISLDDPNASLDWVLNKPIATVESSYVVNTQAVPLQPNLDSSPRSINLLTAIGLDLHHGFMAKREDIDEYGWRNFGDLYADHEKAGYIGSDLFVSHYNNQYDPIFGFLRQFILSGNPQWFELADDLAKHVTHIDIYHTELDKAEYNGGLFWHTDHYVKAYTATHRSYSKLQESDAYQDHAGGGGPGGQHCYTTGLTYHYFLTGNENSKQAVLTLSNWITHVYEGTGTCLEVLLAIKNRKLAGFKNQLTGQYPLDRGTGNYIIALLDSFELTNDDQYLEQAEHIIQNTIHPNDDVSTRALDDVENCWFYTALLQAVCRYLDVKRVQGMFDEPFYYARDALLNYADWMVDFEYPYLEKPDILEFPNDTWTAQDLRKVHVFAAAWYYSHFNLPVYLQKARYFQSYVQQKIAISPEKTSTRVLALLMQNSGTLEYYQNVIQPITSAERKTDWPLPSYLTVTTLQGCCDQLFKRLRHLSLKKEYRWLMKRIAK